MPDTGPVQTRDQVYWGGKLRQTRIPDPRSPQRDDAQPPQRLIRRSRPPPGISIRAALPGRLRPPARRQRALSATIPGRGNSILAKSSGAGERLLGGLADGIVRVRRGARSRERHPDKTFIGRIARGLRLPGLPLRPRGTDRGEGDAREVRRTCRPALRAGAGEEPEGSPRLGKYVRRWARWVRAGLETARGALARFGHGHTDLRRQALRSHRRPGAAQAQLRLGVPDSASAVASNMSRRVSLVVAQSSNAKQPHPSRDVRCATRRGRSASRVWSKLPRICSSAPRSRAYDRVASSYTRP